MAEVLLFHHAQGLTSGVLSFAEELRSAGHTVHTPDLLDGRLFDSIAEGMAYARGLGFEEIGARGARAAEGTARTCRLTAWRRTTRASST